MQQTFKTYEVERIAKMRVRQGKCEYLLKYVRFPRSCNTWEPAENISCDELLNEFEKKLEAKMKHIRMKAEKKLPIRQVLQRASAKKARNWISKLLMQYRKSALLKTESRDIKKGIIRKDCFKIPSRTSAKQKMSCRKRDRKAPSRISTMKSQKSNKESFTSSRKLTALVEPMVDPNITIKRKPMPLEHICINIPSHPLSLYGFARGLEPERIVGASKEAGTLMLLIKWKNLKDVDIVSASEANLKCPQIVIKYYQSKIECC